MHGFINENVEKKSKVLTDEHRGYKGLKNFKHYSVSHNVGQYVKGQVHTNGIESFWALLKRGYQGIYHHMSVKHLNRYVNEFSGRHNTRKLSTIDQMAFMAHRMNDKRLKYKELTA